MITCLFEDQAAALTPEAIGWVAERYQKLVRYHVPLQDEISI